MIKKVTKLVTNFVFIALVIIWLPSPFVDYFVKNPKEPSQLGQWDEPHERKFALIDVKG
jgi:hypothetical protein